MPSFPTEQQEAIELVRSPRRRHRRRKAAAAAITRPHTLIVGGTRGIGRALVEILLQENHQVSVIGRTSPARGGSPAARYWLADLSHGEQLTRTLAEIVRKRGKLKNLILCQRYRGEGDSWAGEMEISLSMTKKIIEYLSERFEKTGGGSIVMIGSIASSFIAGEQPLGYHVAKAGLSQMVRYYAVALGRKNIRVNAVSSATIIKEESKEFYARNEELCNLYRRITPLGRMGTAEDVCNVIAFLCSVRGSFVTGQNVVVDGGISLQWHESLARELAALHDLKVTRQAGGGGS